MNYEESAARRPADGSLPTAPPPAPKLGDGAPDLNAADLEGGDESLFLDEDLPDDDDLE